MEAHIIIVPEALPYSEFSAYLRTVTSDEFFGYSIITIGVVMLLLSIFRYINQKKILFVQSVADVINLILNDNSYIKYQRLSLAEVFIIVPLTFVGLVIANGVLSNLKSYLTRPVLQPQINTIEGIYKSPLPILVFTKGWKKGLIDALTYRTKHEGWSNKIIVLEGQQYYEQLIMYNTSISILTSPKYMHLLLRLQKRLSIKGFHNPRIEISKYLAAPFVFNKFLFFERLNELTHRIQSAGLYDLWWRKSHIEMEKKIIKTNVERSRNQNKVVENFEIPIFIIYGWLAGVIVLVLEIVWKKFKLQRMMSYQGFLFKI